MATRDGNSNSGRVELARRVVDAPGGRFSTELGLDLDHGSTPVERWFLAATLFGAPIPAAVAERTYRALSDAGVHTIADAGQRSWNELVALLDVGGYTRYDFRTATRLHDLARALDEHHTGSVASLAVVTDPRALEAALGDLPGWGQATVRIFLRELRGIWPGADPPLDERALSAATHLGLVAPSSTHAGAAGSCGSPCTIAPTLAALAGRTALSSRRHPRRRVDDRGRSPAIGKRTSERHEFGTIGPRRERGRTVMLDEATRLRGSWSTGVRAAAPTWRNARWNSLW
jgi:hypothetical protein